MKTIISYYDRDKSLLHLRKGKFVIDNEVANYIKYLLKRSNKLKKVLGK